MKRTENVHESVRIETYAEVWWDNPKKIDQLEDIGSYGR